MKAKRHPISSAWRCTGMILVLAGLPMADGEGGLLASQQMPPADQTLQNMFRFGLTESAIAYARREVELFADSASMRARWKLRLMECYAQAALWEEEDRDVDWEHCDRVLGEELQRFPQNPRIPWLQWQQGRCRLLRAQYNLAKYRAAPADEMPREKALEMVREILTLMESLEADIQRRQPIAARQVSGRKTEAPAQQLQRLRVDVGLMRCEAFLIRSQLYPVDSKDRRAAATDGEAQAAQILGITGEDWDSRDALEVARATANLELGRANESLQKLALVARDGNSASALRAAATAIRYLAEHGQSSRAESFLPRLAGPELALAKIRIGLAELRGIRSEQDREERLNAILALSRTVGNQYGNYWRNRAEALLLGSGSTQTKSPESNTNYDLMILEVRQLLAAKKQARAVEKLLEFRDNEEAGGNAVVALRLAAQASALLQREEKWQEAAEAVRGISRRFPEEDASATSHFQAVLCSLQALRAQISEEARRKQYESDLVAQLELWPDSNEADEAQQWLETWWKGQARVVDLAEALVRRAERATKKETLRKAMLAWLLLILESDGPEQQQLILESAQKTEIELLPHKIAFRVYLLLAEMLPVEQASADDSKSTQALTRLLGSTTDSMDQTMLAGLAMLQAARSEQLSTARRNAVDWDLNQLPEELAWRFCSSFQAAIDLHESTEPASWCRPLQLEQGVVDGLIQQENLGLKLVGYRIALWLGDRRALEELRNLADANRRDAAAQMQLAWALSVSEPARSEQIARTVIVGSKKGSELNYRANWLRMRVLILQGRKSDAQQAAKLLLASTVVSDLTWKSRFERMAQP